MVFDFADSDLQRVKRGWFDDEGEVLLTAEGVEDSEKFLAPLNVNPSAPKKKPKEKTAPTPRRLQNDPPTAEEIAVGLKCVESGTKSSIKTLRKILLVHICGLKGIQVDAKCTGPALLDKLEDWVRFNFAPRQSPDILIQCLASEGGDCITERRHSSSQAPTT